MATVAPNTEVVAASIDTIVTLNGVRNTIKQFVQAGAIRMIGNKFIFVGPADLIGSMASTPTHIDWLQKGYPMRSSAASPSRYDEVLIGGTWMNMVDAAKNGL